MANYENLKNSIRSVIRENGTNAITGNILQQTLVAMIGSLGAGYQFAGIATENTDPGTPDQNVFYLAGPGRYTKFNDLRVREGSFGILKYNGTWSVDSVAPGPFVAGSGQYSAVLKSVSGQSVASGFCAVSEGSRNIASGDYSHAEGEQNSVTGDYSHVEGHDNRVDGNSAHAEGNSTIASGEASHAEGTQSTANGDYSHAEGEGTKTTNQGEHAEGTYNYSYEAQGGERPFATLHSVGIGGSNSNRRNAVEVLANGEMFLHGVGGYDGTNMRQGSGASMEIDWLVGSVQKILNGLAPRLTDADRGHILPEEFADILQYAPAIFYNGGISPRVSIQDLIIADNRGHRILDEIIEQVGSISELQAAWGHISYDAVSGRPINNGLQFLYSKRGTPGLYFDEI